jgi:hypothetical protein
MRFYETHFEEYLAEEARMSLHPKLQQAMDILPASLSDLPNVIMYGQPGTGKYTQMLKLIAKYSPSNLKYEKKLTVQGQKGPHMYKISDVHFEVDMALLGCNAKTSWNEAYSDIMDVIAARSDRAGIILCKNFHATHPELLESFYSYMQTTHRQSVKVRFALITEQLSSLPDAIMDSCYIIRVPRPARTMYAKCLRKKIDKSIPTREIGNAKMVKASSASRHRPQAAVCDRVLTLLEDPATIKLTELRDAIYNIFIYEQSVPSCILYILEALISEDRIKHEDVTDVLMEMHTRIQFFNNNYRPIYHLEAMMVYLLTKIHGLEDSA